ncbi:MAG TPA: di-heme-cytochrome C peroxidase [Allosphingosinicella sp.]
MGASRIASGIRGALLAGAAAIGAAASPAAADPVYVKQGSKWNAAARAEYYTRDQGSRIIPLAWLKALKTSDGRPFLHDGLARYGYLAGPNSASGLPLGFMVAGPVGTQWAAMNCSACHTRQIEVDGKEYRIDGGPALTDFQAFLSDLVAAVGRTLAEDDSFAAFAAGVPNAPVDLRQQVSLWYQRENTLMQGALPVDRPWGLGRLDAVSMIYNRLAALDLGAPPSYLIAENVRLANAPVRYPFLWNAPKQDRTQWPGFAQNGNDLLARARNLGQVYGVFGIFRPSNRNRRVDFLGGNSTSWPGLAKLEQMVKKIGPPQWPWPRTRAQDRLAAQGKAIYERTDWRQGGCAGCHGIKSGPIRPVLNFTWATPLCDVGTDTRQYGILGRTAKTGILQGSRRPFGQPMDAEAGALDLLGVAVVGSIFQEIFGFSIFSYEDVATPPPAAARDLLSTYAPPTTELCGDLAGPKKYESRVMQGIWATAPYLHNGSVPTLADLLRKPEDRPASFALGNRYDTNLVGLARDQDGRWGTRETTGCDDLDSGNSRCGHDFGTDLSDPEKAALLEYLKIL